MAGTKRSTSTKSKKRPEGSPSLASLSALALRRRLSAQPENSLESGTLQLKLGRAAYGYGFTGAIAFLINSLFLYASVTWLTFPVFPFQYVDLFLWLIPLSVGALSASFALLTKWEPYRGHRSSGHFLLTATALVYSCMFAAAVLLMGMRVFPRLDPFLMYPVSVSGITLVLLSMAATWAGHGARKVGSVVGAAGIPVVMVGGFLYGAYPVSASAPSTVLLFVLVYFAGALLSLMSGAALHIIASSTSAAKREILIADDSKQQQLAAQLRELQKALTFRQDGLARREAAVEAQEGELRDEMGKSSVQQRELEAAQNAINTRERELRDFERKLGAMRAETDSRAEQMKMKEADLTQVASHLEETRKATAAREAALADLEKQTKRAAVDLEAAKRQADARLKAAAEQEDHARSEDGKLDKKRKELLKLEKDLQLRESQMTMRKEKSEATLTKGERERAGEMSDWQSKLQSKEKELGQLEVELKTLETQLKDRYDQATRIEKQVQDDRKHLDAKDRELVAREKAISDRESGIDPQIAAIDRERKTIQEQAKRLAEKEARYSEVLKDARVREADATTSQDDVAKRVAALDRRQKMLDEKDMSLRAEIRRLSDENRELLSTKKELEQREQEMSLRELEMEQKMRESRASHAPGIKDTDRDKQLEMWEDRLRQREEEFKRQTYQKEKEIELRERAVKASIQTGIQGGADEGTVEETKKDKVKTGTARLDDLLYGGIPLPSNFLVSGPAFAGKEVLLLNFVAEGLKKGVPAIIITTSKPPVEVAKDMAPILPTFVEYEQLGLVYWLDCSQQTSGKVVREKTTYKLHGPTDFDNILGVTGELDEKFRAKYPYFRVAYFSLSSAITGTDSNAGIAFVQRLVNRFRQTKAVVGYAVERGMHTDQQLEALEHLVDGAIHFKSDKQKTMLQVVGLGEVQTRDWVPYKFSNKAVMIGSFQLERIR